MNKRFFSEASFWNTKINAAPQIHPRNAHFISLLSGEAGQKGFHINLHSWTMPIYEVTAKTPTVTVGKRMRHATQEGSIFWIHSEEYIKAVGEANHPLGHAGGFGPGVPIPEEAFPDTQTDAHMSLVDYERGLAWDMWAVQKKPDGTWWANSGITYDLYGSGVFDLNVWEGIHNGESAHMYGACHASGVPSIAGVIMQEELLAGEIRHKLNWSCEAVALLEHIYPPATWTDGAYPGGIPQGALIQLDPAVDLGQFGLTPEEGVIAKALQEYGAVLAMYSNGTTLYGEGLWTSQDKSWEGYLTENGMMKIPFECFRFLESGTRIERGMVPMQHPGIMGTYYRKTGLPNFEYQK